VSDTVTDNGISTRCRLAMVVL